MENTIKRTGLKPLEVRTVVVGFLLSGIVIGVTALSYVLNMTFRYQFLVWVIGIAFAAVALLLLEWPRAFRSPPGELPKGRLRQFLLLAMPLAFVLDSQICGLGVKACSTLCNVISVSLIGLAPVSAVGILLGVMRPAGTTDPAA
jgi:hypothetical protein